MVVVSKSTCQGAAGDVALESRPERFELTADFDLDKSAPLCRPGPSDRAIFETLKNGALVLDNLLGRPLEVEVRDSLEKAMKILKQKMSKEGILQEVKRRRFYEKPSVKRKRKMREARKRRRREQKRRAPSK